MRRIAGILAMLLSVSLLAGCATKARSDSLTTTLKAYGSTLRWGDFQSAAQFIDPKIRAAHPLTPLQLSRFQQVRVTEYNDDAGPVPINDTDVSQTAVINLVNIHTQAERSVVDHQTWHYDEATKHWWLMNSLPDITRD